MCACERIFYMNVLLLFCLMMLRVSVVSLGFDIFQSTAQRAARDGERERRSARQRVKEGDGE